MTTIRVDPLDPDPELVERAAAVLRRGGLVAFPTETVYGLGANALDEAAVRKIFEAKGRPSYNPLIVHVPDAARARELVRLWPDTAERLAEAFWPGPLTLVLPKRPEVPDLVTAGLATVAVRVPAHPVARALIQAAGVPVAAPSANRFTRVSPTTAEHVEKGLGERVDLVVDGGPAMVGIESTVLDLSGDRPVLLRPGAVGRAELEAVVGAVDVAGAPAEAGAARPSPGMMDRHYAPHATLRLFDPAEREAARELAREAALAGRTVGALLLTPLDAQIRHPIAMPKEPGGYARLLYAALHSLDDLGCGLILVERIPDSPEWAGVADRLRRAAH